MTPFLQFAIALAVVIFAAKLGGYISLRLGQPSVLGELMIGIILGPSVFDLLHITYFTSAEHVEEVIHQLAEIGVLLLMFIAGLDLHITDLVKSGKVAFLAGVLGVVFPLGLGVGTGLAFGLDAQASIFIGLILSATSVSISAQTLMELKVLRSRIGVGLLGSAVFDDVLVVLLLSIFIAAAKPGMGAGFLDIVWIIARMALYLGIAAFAGFYLLPKLSQRVHNLPISQGVTAFAIVIILLFGWSAETLGGMAAITGAFLAGLVLAQSPVKERIESGISSLAYGMFVPVFFINVGLSANIRELGGENFWLLWVLTGMAVVGKVLGSGLGANLGGFSRLEALQLGVGMMSRGEVGLIVAAVGISEGLIQQNIFSVIVGVVIITTLLTPPSLRILFRRSEPERTHIQEISEGE
jgi:Kef-type K+ transport system membrane component KefB